MLSTLATTVVAHPGWAAGPGGPGWWIVFPIFWGLVWLTVIFLLVRRGRRMWAAGGPPWARGTGPDPVSVLGERYARGEIDEAEYRRRLAVLRPETPGRRPQ
ncbi:MAG: SHOCT domain-containing protein [Promicromonosporaceae bacterium]|nr:SHOCT domain-containing protein [Promicromonosporaceae bacterium]